MTTRRNRPAVEPLEGRALAAVAPGDGPVPVRVWVDRRTMPADFDPIAVQDRLRTIGADLNVRIDVVPIGIPYEVLGPGGVVLGPTPPSYRGIITDTGSPRVDYIEVYAHWEPALLGIATWHWGNAIQINPTTTGGSPAPDILYSNILFHETFYHGVIGAVHFPLGLIEFEQTPLGSNTVEGRVPLVLTPEDLDRLGRWLGTP